MRDSQLRGLGWTFRTRVLAGAVVLAQAISSSTQAQSFTWTDPVSSAFSAPGNWPGNTSPPAGGSAAIAVTLQASGAGVATNDLGAPFVLNRLTLAPQYGYAFGVPRTFAGWAVTTPGTS